LPQKGNLCSQWSERNFETTSSQNLRVLTPNGGEVLKKEKPRTVPKNLKDGRDYRIKIIDIQRRISDFSDSDFTITSSPVSLGNSSLMRQLENQTASLSKALFELIENLKNLE